MFLTSWAGVLTGGEHKPPPVRTERIVRVQLQLVIVLIVYGALAGTIWVVVTILNISTGVVGSFSLDGSNRTDEPGPSEVQ